MSWGRSCYEGHRKSTTMSNPYVRRSYSFQNDDRDGGSGDAVTVGTDVVDRGAEGSSWQAVSTFVESTVELGSKVEGVYDERLILSHMFLNDELKALYLFSISACSVEALPCVPACAETVCSLICISKCFFSPSTLSTSHCVVLNGSKNPPEKSHQQRSAICMVGGIISRGRFGMRERSASAKVVMLSDHGLSRGVSMGAGGQ